MPNSYGRIPSCMDLVQEYSANRVFPTLKEWNMPKLKGEKKKNELI
jgi:pyrimidine deaminase RibD-like protein